MQKISVEGRHAFHQSIAYRFWEKMKGNYSSQVKKKYIKQLLIELQGETDNHDMNPVLSVPMPRSLETTWNCLKNLELLS